jgi:hypothetical protein
MRAGAPSRRFQRTIGIGCPGSTVPLTRATKDQATQNRRVRSQWTIENRLHFVCDTAFAEDASKVRTDHGPENMATLRSFAISQLRAVGHTNIAAGLREMSYEPFRRPLDLLGLI